MQDPLLVLVEDALLDAAALDAALDVAGPLELVEPDVAATLEVVELDVVARGPVTLVPVVPPPTPADLPPDPALCEEPQALALTHAAAPATRTEIRNARRLRRESVTQSSSRGSPRASSESSAEPPVNRRVAPAPA
jgi:hypothetical protein